MVGREFSLYIIAEHVEVDQDRRVLRRCAVLQEVLHRVGDEQFGCDAGPVGGVEEFGG